MGLMFNYLVLPLSSFLSTSTPSFSSMSPREYSRKAFIPDTSGLLMATKTMPENAEKASNAAALTIRAAFGILFKYLLVFVRIIVELE